MMVILGLLTAISYVINAILVRYEDLLWQLTNPVLLPFERKVKHPDHQPVSLGAAKYLVIGLGDTGEAALKRFRQQNESAVGIDINPDRVKQLIDAGCRVLYADAQDAHFWEELDMKKVNTILLAMSGDIYTKTFIVEQLRKKKYQGMIRVLTQNLREAELVKRAGGEPVLVPAAQMGETLANLSINGA